ncbi:MAG: LacI family DNA-binding transcriptional regulator [Lachnospiraceae bacterium]
MAKSVTMRDIAAEIGVSTVTVSKALTGREGVSEEMRERIKQKAAEMGYRYNSVAKAMKEGENGSIGILVADRFFEDNSFYNKLYRNLVLKMNEAGYFGVLEILSQENEELLRLPNMINSSRIDGIVVMGQISEEYLAELKKTDIPQVLLDFYVECSGMESVISDGIHGSCCLTDYLIEMGHRDICFVGSIYATSSIMDRYIGFYKSMLQHGISCSAEKVIEDRDRNGKFIELALPDRMPTAFVCNCDQVAYLLVQRLKDMGYRVPEDVSVVGFDDYIYSTLSDPKLTTYRVNMEEMAKAAVSVVSKKLKNPGYAKGRTVVDGDIVIRDSVKRI